MAREFFKNLPNQTTPLTAPRLNGLLNGDEAMGNIVVDSVSSKNLFNENAILRGYELIGSGTYIGGVNTNSSWYVSDYIEVEPNKQYYLTKGSSGGSNILYNTNKEYVAIVSASSGVITIPNNNNIKYMRFNGLLSQLSNVQFEKGTTATDYAPYQGLDKINDLIAYNDTSVLVNPTKIPITPLVGSNYSGFGNSFYYKIGSRVHIHLGLQGLTPNTSQTVFAPPAGYRPTTNVAGAGVGGSMSEVVPYQLGNSVSLRSPSQYALIDIEYDAFS